LEGIKMKKQAMIVEDDYGNEKIVYEGGIF